MEQMYHNRDEIQAWQGTKTFKTRNYLLPRNRIQSLNHSIDKIIHCNTFRQKSTLLRSSLMCLILFEKFVGDIRIARNLDVHGYFASKT